MTLVRGETWNDGVADCCMVPSRRSSGYSNGRVSKCRVTVGCIARWRYPRNQMKPVAQQTKAGLESRSRLVLTAQQLSWTLSTVLSEYRICQQIVGDKSSADKTYRGTTSLRMTGRGRRGCVRVKGMESNPPYVDVSGDKKQSL